MAFPTTVLAFECVVLFDGVTETNLTAYIHDGMTRTFGRTNPTSSMDAGRVNFTLDAPRGDPGRFNPWDPAGPYWRPKGWLGAPCRIRLESGAWFYGRISGAEPYWDKDGDGHCSIEASGPLRWLTLNAPTRSPIERAILAADPMHYWQLNEGADATIIASGLPKGEALFQSQLTFDTVDGPPGAPGKYAEFMSGGAFYGYVAFGLNRTATVTCFEFWFRAQLTDPAGDAGLRLFGWSADGAYGEWFVRGSYTGGGSPFVFSQAETVGSTWNPSTVSCDWADGNWHQVVITQTETGGNVTSSMTVDGSAASSDTLATTMGRILNVEAPWTHTQVVNSLENIASYSVGHIAIYSATPSDHSGAGDGYAGEAAGTRFARLCTEEGYTASVTAGATALMGPQPVDKVLKLLRECEATDEARILEIPTSPTTLGFVPRVARYNTAATLALDANDLSATPKPRGVIGYRVGEVVISRAGGTSVVAKDQDILDSGGTSIQPQNVNPYADSQLQPLAEFLLGVNSSDDAKVSTISLDFGSVNGSAHLGTWKTAIAAGANTVHVTVGGWSGYPDGLDAFIEGGTERISQVDWTLDAVISPALPYRMFTRGSSTFGRRDGAHSYLAAALDTDDLVFQVCTSSGAKWTTTDAEQPSPIEVAGEKITLSDVAGTGVSAFVAAGTEQHADNASVAPGLPAGVALGDTMYLLATIRNSGTGTPNTPAGWTLLADGSNMRLFGRAYATGDAAPTVTFAGGVSGATCSARIFAVTGGSLGIAATAALQLNASAQNIATPGLTIADGGGPVLVIWFGWKQDDCTNMTSVAAGTLAFRSWTSTGDDQSLIASYLITTDPATIAASSFTVTGGASAISRGGVIAMRADAQLFTASARSANSVVKSQTARTSVRVWRPGRRGL